MEKRHKHRGTAQPKIIKESSHKLKSKIVNVESFNQWKRDAAINFGNRQLVLLPHMCLTQNKNLVSGRRVTSGESCAVY